MKKSILVPGLATLALLSACVTDPSAVTGGTMSSSAPAAMESSIDAMMQSSGSMMDASSSAMMNASSSAPAMMNSSSSAPQAMDSSTPAATGDARVIEVSMNNWTFSPAKIDVKKGEKVVIRVKGVEGIHSFAVPTMNINIAANPGETKDVEIPTDKTGTFDFRCFIPCGPGHKSMVGQLVIS